MCGLEVKMPRKKGPDIRNGNWLFYDDQLLTTLLGVSATTLSRLTVVGPERLTEIIAESDDTIQAALEQLREQTMATSPNPKKSVGLAWIFAAKMVPKGPQMARGTVLREEAFDRTHSKTDYIGPADFLPSSRAYIEQTRTLGYASRLRLGLEGWSDVRDGGWLQIQPK